MAQTVIHGTTAVSDFDLDVTVVRNTDVFGALMRSTDDGCGSTCPACASGAGGNTGDDGEYLAV